MYDTLYTVGVGINSKDKVRFQVDFEYCSANQKLDTNLIYVRKLNEN